MDGRCGRWTTGEYDREGERMSLFISQSFVAHSGATLPFKIECDALSAEDIATLAGIVAREVAYGEVYGIARGGIRFASALARARQRTSPVVLIADDVLTTARSMEEARRLYEGRPTQGVVIFARGACPAWITPLFTLNPLWRWRDDGANTSERGTA